MGQECQRSICMERVEKGMCIDIAKTGKIIQKNIDQIDEINRRLKKIEKSKEFFELFLNYFEILQEKLMENHKQPKLEHAQSQYDEKKASNLTSVSSSTNSIQTPDKILGKMKKEMEKFYQILNHYSNTSTTIAKGHTRIPKSQLKECLIKINSQAKKLSIQIDFPIFPKDVSTSNTMEQNDLQQLMKPNAIAQADIQQQNI